MPWTEERRPRRNHPLDVHAQPAHHYKSSLLLVVFLLSVASIGFEITLARIFSISQWNHLAFMVISIAMLGFAAGGTLLCIQEVRDTTWYRRMPLNHWLGHLVLLFALTIIMALLVLALLPLDYFRLPLEPIQAGYLLTAFMLLAWPFFCVGLVIGLAYALLPQQSGQIYFATMSGSALGALLPWPLLPIFGETGLIVILALLPVGPVFLSRTVLKPAFPEIIKMRLRHPARLNRLALGVIILSAGLLLADRWVVPLKPSPYKALSQNLMLPSSKITATFHSLRGRYDVFTSPYIRFAPGLSLQYDNALPSQTAFFKDADNQVVLYKGPPSQMRRFTTFLLAFFGYHLVPAPENILVVLHNGGMSLPCALAANARNITVIAQDPIAARLIEQHYGLPVTHQNPRAALARSTKRFDVIHLENWGSSLLGASALSYENTLTIEAFKLYFDHLKPNGVLLIARKLLLPPADSVRLWATAYEGLKASNLAAPERHIIVLRNWDTYLLIVSARPLATTAKLAAMAKQLNFDLVYHPEITPQRPNRFNVFPEPYHYETLQALRKAYQNGRADTFFKEYLLDVEPQSDGRPFPGRLLKWSQVRQYYRTMGSRLYTLLLSGEVVVAVVLIEAIVVSVVILVFPLFFLGRTRGTLPLSALIFFLNVGFGFMLVELFFIHAYTLFFSEPVVSFTVVLTGILISSSIGGYFSQRLTRHWLRYGVITLVLLLAGLWLTLDYWATVCLNAPGWWGYLLILALLFPVGFLLGLPFPLAIRLLLPTPAQRAHAWAVNGCASVVTSVAAMQLAISVGLAALLSGAILSYAIALFSLKSPK